MDIMEDQIKGTEELSTLAAQAQKYNLQCCLFFLPSLGVSIETPCAMNIRKGWDQVDVI